METGPHRALAVATVAATVHLGYLPTAAVLPAVAAAALFSGGATSPDIDNQGWWKRLDRWLPDEWLGHGGPLQHRGIMHWWGLPVLFWWLAGSHLTGRPADVAAGAMIGWCVHLAGDCVFGMRGPGHERGVPLLLWWGHVGVGLRADGRLERAVGSLMVVAGIWWMVGLAVPLPYQPHPVAVPASWR